MTETHADEPRLYALFDTLGIPYQTEEHEAVFTVEESQCVKSRLPGGHTKNLFLKDKSGQFVLISAISSTPIKLNKLHPHIGTKRLSFGKEPDLFEQLGVRPGSVTVFSVINDATSSVKLILDKALFDHDSVWFHPLRNTASTRIASQDLLAFSEETGHVPLILDFAQLSEGET